MILRIGLGGGLADPTSISVATGWLLVAACALSFICGPPAFVLSKRRSAEPHSSRRPARGKGSPERADNRHVRTLAAIARRTGSAPCPALRDNRNSRFRTARWRAPARVEGYLPGAAKCR